MVLKIRSYLSFGSFFFSDKKISDNKEKNNSPGIGARGGEVSHKSIKNFMEKILNNPAFQIGIFVVGVGGLVFVSYKLNLRTKIPAAFIGAIHQKNGTPNVFSKYKYEIGYDISEDILSMKDILLSIDEKVSSENESALLTKLEEIIGLEEMHLNDDFKIIIVPTISFIIFLALRGRMVKKGTILSILRILKKLFKKGRISARLFKALVVRIGKDWGIGRKTIKKYLDLKSIPA